MRDLTILLDLTVGRVADIAEAVVAAGVDLSAGCLFQRTEGRVAHIAVADEDVTAVTKIAATFGATVADDRDCVIVPPGYPGGGAAVARRVADAGIPVLIVYYGSHGEIVIGTTDTGKARDALNLS